MMRNGDGWKQRPGRPTSGYYDKARAYVRMAEVIVEHSKTPAKATNDAPS